MRIHLWGTDYRRGTPEMRKKLFFSAEERAARIRELLALGFDDLVYLYTCNRIEFYTTAPNHFCDTRRTWLKLLEHLGLGEEAYYRGFQLEGKSALRHMVRVASSLESLVVGESQILGQLKDALKWTKDQGLPVNPTTDRAFKLSFETAKKVRSETSIGERPTSVANLGLQHLEAQEIAYPLKSAVVVGRSPISLLILQWLHKNRPAAPLYWVNRNTETLARYEESKFSTLVSLPAFLEEPSKYPFSHLFTATSSREPIFVPAFLKKLSCDPRLLFDFAEPPDVELGQDPWCGIKLIKLEDLQVEARANYLGRAQAVEHAEIIVENALKGYFMQQKQAPLLRDFNEVEPRFWNELESALALLQQDFPAEMQPKIKRWAEALVRKNLHNSREQLRLVLQQVAEPTEDPLPAF